MATNTIEATAQPVAEPFRDVTDDELLELVTAGIEEAVARAEAKADRVESPDADAAEIREALAFAARLRGLLPVWGHHGRLAEAFHAGVDATDRIRGGE